MFWFLIVLGFCECLCLYQYERERGNIIRLEKNMLTGEKDSLSNKEAAVDALLLRYKRGELQFGLRNNSFQTSSMHFFKAKPLIDRSWIFGLLEMMPKGALLHIHGTASVSDRWVRRNIYYKRGLIFCTNKHNLTIYTFRQNRGLHECVTKYHRVDDSILRLRKNRKGKRRKKNFRTRPLLDDPYSIFSPNPEVVYNTANAVWKKFEDIFEAFGDVLLYEPVFTMYYKRMLTEMFDDHIMYAEVRMNFNPLYGPNNISYTQEQTIEKFIKIVEDFRESHEKFLGVKIIFCGRKLYDDKRITHQLNLFLEYQKLYPKYFIGFDLVGHEDTQRSFYQIKKVLLKYNNISFFFHAGETNIFGGISDQNMLDAVLHKSKRIGHGFSLFKHPVLMDRIKEQNIAIEVCPISNQVLNLLPDLRNHPAAEYLARGIPMVICNDDPGFWSARGLSHDFYYLIVSVAPEYAGLRTLKKLVYDSLQYAMLTKEEYHQALAILDDAWAVFIQKAFHMKHYG